MAFTALDMFAGAVDVTFLMCYRPDHPEDPSTKQLIRFSAAHPDIRPLQWGGLALPHMTGEYPSAQLLFRRES